MRLNPFKFQVTSYKLRVTSYKFFKPLASYLIPLFVFCFLPSASAQRFIGGVTAGFNLAQVDGDEVFGYKKVGFNGGPFVKLMLDKKQRFSLTMELLYNQKGAVQKIPVPQGNLVAFGDTALFDPNYPDYDRKIFYKLRTDYLEIPLVVHFEDPRSKIGIGIGFAWSRLTYIIETQMNFRNVVVDTGARRLTTAIGDGRYHKNDWSIIADVNIPIYKKLKFTFRFQYSLAPFGEVREFYEHNGNFKPNPNSTGVERRWPFHNVLTFRLVYSINEKYMENNNYDDQWKRIGPKWVRDPEAMRW